MKRKLVTLLLSLCSIVSVGSFAACNANDPSDNSSSFLESSSSSSSFEEPEEDVENKTPTEGLQYALSEDESYYAVTGIGTATDTEIVIPATYNDLPVKEITRLLGEGATVTITSIAIPQSIEKIDAGVFISLSLTKITVSKHNLNYASANGVLYNKDKTTLLQYPAGKTATSFTVPNSVTTIDIPAFTSQYLTSINIGSGVTTIEEGAFYYIPAVNNISVDANNTNYTTIDGNLYSKDKHVLVKYAEGKTATSFTIPNGVTTIETIAFMRAPLTSVTIPNSVTKIGESAFESSALTSIVIPDSVKTIGEGAFSMCENLTDVTLENGLKTIESYTFDFCYSLTELIIPDSVEIIKTMAFGSSCITHLTIGSGVKMIEEFPFGYCATLVSITFTNTNGWFVTEEPTATSGIRVDVTDPTQNVANLYWNYWGYWKRTE